MLSYRTSAPTSTPSSEKIQGRHRERAAYVYIRQSTPRQVQENRESQRNQYALTERAQQLGWIAERIQVIDADLGQSGQERERRGFQQLVTEVSLGHVGIVLAYDASRLARNNADWYELLDLAALVGTLIGDSEAVYEPRSYNDRLLLGLRGMLSEAELHLLHLRLDAGRLRQVAAGTFRQHLPTGLLRVASGAVVKDPDQQVQRTIELVFALFASLHSVHRIVRRLRQDAILLPRRQLGGPQAGEVLWRLPSAGAVLAQLHNPAYAGAFAYGRRGPTEEVRRGHRRIVQQPQEDWLALQQGVYPAYISWEQYMANQECLANNRYVYLRQMQGAPRSGTALLAGVAACGRCGRQMYVRYRPAVRYVCRGRSDSHDLNTCLNVDGHTIEAAVVAAFFHALQPAELDVLEAALAAQAAERAQRLQYHADQVQRATYEAHLAEKQYRAVDPENRLVAAELERRWEVALRLLAEAKDMAAQQGARETTPALDPQLRQQLRQLSGALPTLWDQGRVPPDQQKALLRSLIRRVILTRPAPEALDVSIVWVSGAVSRLTVHPPVGASRELQAYDQIVARIQALSAEGCTDRAIARQLRDEGFQSAHRATLPLRLVRTIRKQEGIPSRFESYRRAQYVEGCWTASGLAHLLGVGVRWVQWEIAVGRIPAHQDPYTKHYLIPDDPHLLEQLRARLERRLARHAHPTPQAPQPAHSGAAQPEEPAVARSQQSGTEQRAHSPHPIS